MLSIYKSLKNPLNTNGMLADSILLAPVSWFETIQDLPREGLTLNTAAVIYNNHTFKPGKGFIELQCAPFINQFGSQTTGSIGKAGFKHNLKVQLNGSYAHLHATIATLLNEALIVLVKDGRCINEYYQMGNSGRYTWMKATFNTGESKGAAKAYTVEFETVSKSISIYAGSVTMLPNIQVLNFQIVEGNRLIAVGSAEDLSSIDLSFEVGMDMILRMTGTPPPGYSFSINQAGEFIVNTPY